MQTAAIRFFCFISAHHKTVRHIARAVERARLGNRFAVDNQFAGRATVQIGCVDGAEFNHQIHCFFLRGAQTAACAAPVNDQEKEGAVCPLTDTGPRLDTAAAGSDDGGRFSVDNQEWRVRVVKGNRVTEALL